MVALVPFQFSGTPISPRRHRWRLSLLTAPCTKHIRKLGRCGMCFSSISLPEPTKIDKHLRSRNIKNLKPIMMNHLNRPFYQCPEKPDLPVEQAMPKIRVKPAWEGKRVSRNSEKSMQLVALKKNYIYIYIYKLYCNRRKFGS